MYMYQRKVLDGIVNHANKHINLARGVYPRTENREGDVILTDSHRLVVTSREVTGYTDSDLSGLFEYPLPSLCGYDTTVKLPSIETLRAFRREMKKAHKLKTLERCWPLDTGDSYIFIDSKYLLDALTLMPSAETALVDACCWYKPAYINADGFEMYICPVRVDPWDRKKVVGNAQRFMGPGKSENAA